MPPSSPSRSTGFLYCVSVTGITGERDRLPLELLDQLRWLRTQTKLPLCVGFGVSKPEHVRMLRDAVDGMIARRCSWCVKLEQAGDAAAGGGGRPTMGAGSPAVADARCCRKPHA